MLGVEKMLKNVSGLGISRELYRGLEVGESTVHCKN